MRRAAGLSLLLLFSGCNGACERTKVTASHAASDAAAVSLGTVDAGIAPAKLAAGVPRVFYGKSPTQVADIAVEELVVVRDDTGVRAWLAQAGGPDELKATLDEAGHLRVAKSGLHAAIDIALYDDGTFEGEKKYEDGSKAKWVRVPFIPLEEKQLATARGFAGFLGQNVRYRMKLSQKGSAIEGVARYATSREEFRVRGTVDAKTRVMSADEIDGAGKITGHVDALVLGYVRSAPYSQEMTIVGTWSSPDKKRVLPLKLPNGFYPDRIVVAGGAALSLQEHYDQDCDVIHEYVWPVVDGAPAGVAEKLEPAFKSLVLQGPSPDPVSAESVAALKAGTRVKRDKCKDDPELRGTESGITTPTALRGTWVALEVEHYVQQGSTSGMVWHDCFAVDLATGEKVQPGRLLDSRTITKLTDRARKEAFADVPDAGPDFDPSLVEGIRSAAESMNLADAPMCIGDKKVRFKIVQHRVFGPAQPEFDRDEVAKMLPAGKLRELLAPK